MGTGYIERGVMLGDVLVHIAGGDFADFHTGLLRHEGLHRLVTLAGNAVEAHQVAEQKVVAVATADGVVTRRCRFGVADDRVGQILRIDVGLWRLIRVVRLQVVEAHSAVEANGFDIRQVAQQCKAAGGVADGVRIGAAAVAVTRRELVGAVTLGMQRAEVLG
ncbi:hypothetical protein D3C78_600760 [compost metagenome]